MPAISLVVCVREQRDLLDRLLREAQHCYDDLVVVHDGPDTGDVRSLVETAGGRFYERPLEHQQEPHWPFAWEQAKHNWILRLDADEFPSDQMKEWLQSFRHDPEPPADISGFTCAWPLWNGNQTVSKRWPGGRNFLFNRTRVRFFGMVEQVPVADDHFERLELTLHHRPRRKSYGLHNLLVRPQAYRWRERIAHSLLGYPTDLHCWRWNSESWPLNWEEIRRRPIRTLFRRLTRGTLRALRDQWKADRHVYPAAAVSGPIHHAMICLKYWRLKKRHGENK
jgi:hypothetical protein